MQKISFTTRFDETDYAKMKRIAGIEKRSFASLVQYFCSRGIAQYEREHGEIVLDEEDYSSK